MGIDWFSLFIWQYGLVMIDVIFNEEYISPVINILHNYQTTTLLGWE